MAQLDADKASAVACRMGQADKNGWGSAIQQFDQSRRLLVAEIDKLDGSAEPAQKPKLSQEELAQQRRVQSVVGKHRPVAKIRERKKR